MGIIFFTKNLFKLNTPSVSHQNTTFYFEISIFLSSFAIPLTRSFARISGEEGQNTFLFKLEFYFPLYNFLLSIRRLKSIY